MLTGDDAGNLFKQGALLRNISDVCENAETTLVLCHHTKSTVAIPFAPPELDNLAWSGCAEFARQWMLLSRREQYTPGTGCHQLWFSSGGSAGHGGLWALDVTEGLSSDAWGRTWGVTLLHADEARDRAKTRKADAKAEQAEEQLFSRRQAVCRLLAKHPMGLTQSAIRDRCGLDTTRWRIVLAALLEHQEVEEVEVQTGNQTTPKPGFKLRENVNL
jgi:hypothetical protein